MVHVTSARSCKRYGITSHHLKVGGGVRLFSRESETKGVIAEPPIK